MWLVHHIPPLTIDRSRFVPRGCIISFFLRPAALAQRPLALPRAGMVPQKRIFFS